MNYRELGSTGLKVSEIAMGCEGMTEENCTMCAKLFDIAEESDINYFDLYSSNPELRSAVGKALKGRREKFIIQSHLCSVWKNEQYMRTRNLAEVKAGFEEMMRLLQTDYIDVGMIHYCDALSDWDEILRNGILDYARELKAAGKIRHIGISNFNLSECKQAKMILDKAEIPLYGVQNHYSLIARDWEKNGVVGWCRENGISFWAWAVLGIAV